MLPSHLDRAASAYLSLLHASRCQQIDQRARSCQSGKLKATAFPDESGVHRFYTDLHVDRDSRYIVGLRYFNEGRLCNWFAGRGQHLHECCRNYKTCILKGSVARLLGQSGSTVAIVAGRADVHTGAAGSSSPGRAALQHHHLPGGRLLPAGRPTRYSD